MNLAAPCSRKDSSSGTFPPDGETIPTAAISRRDGLEHEPLAHGPQNPAFWEYPIETDAAIPRHPS